MTSSRTCVNDANAFWYTYGQFTIKGNHLAIDNFYKKAYFAYFKVKLGDQDKPWAPHYVCNTCKEHIFDSGLTERENPSPLVYP